RTLPSNRRLGRFHHRRTRHRAGQKTVVAAGSLERNPRVASHGERRARSARNFEPGKVLIRFLSPPCNAPAVEPVRACAKQPPCERKSWWWKMIRTWSSCFVSI